MSETTEVTALFNDVEVKTTVKGREHSIKFPMPTDLASALTEYGEEACFSHLSRSILQWVKQKHSALIEDAEKSDKEITTAMKKIKVERLGTRTKSDKNLAVDYAAEYKAAVEAGDSDRAQAALDQIMALNLNGS